MIKILILLGFLSSLFWKPPSAAAEVILESTGAQGKDVHPHPPSVNSVKSYI